MNIGKEFKSKIRKNHKLTTVNKLKGHLRQISVVKYSPFSDNILVSGSEDKSIKVWDVNKSISLSTLEGHSGTINQIEFLPKSDGNTIISCSKDDCVKFWDMRSKKCEKNFKTENGNIHISCSPDGKEFVVGDKKDIITFYDISTGKIIRKFSSNTEVNCCKWDPSGKKLMMSTVTGDIKIFNYKTYKHVYTITGNVANIYCIEFDNIGKHMFVGSEDSIVSIWDLEELICLGSISESDHYVRALGISFDGKILCISSEKKLIFTFTDSEKLSTNSCLAYVNSVSWHRNKYIIGYYDFTNVYCSSIIT